MDLDSFGFRTTNVYVIETQELRLGFQTFTVRTFVILQEFTPITKIN